MESQKKKSGNKYDSSSALLQGVGLRPTKQRLALAGWLFDGCDKHVTAEHAYAAAAKRRSSISLATIYNTLNIFTTAGLLRQVVIDGGHIYFDTNTSAHHHLFDEKKRLLTDIPASAVRLARLPKLPSGTTLSRVDVVLRVQSRS